ncbi:hypothetical protein [Glycomyces sp. MUSA5-2]|uniref:hypothetical protein n=1 Tax=Glycomyces sp. MUSA5-2 TaxID=2053002 RepID=UPI00300A826E
MLPPRVALVGEHRAGLRTHGEWYRSLLGLGPQRCAADDRPWGSHGCADREMHFWGYLQHSVPSERADDLADRAELFTGDEARMIAALDAQVLAPPSPSSVPGSVGQELELAAPLRGVVPSIPRPRPFPDASGCAVSVGA